jgi:hypothetical protein
MAKDLGKGPVQPGIVDGVDMHQIVARRHHQAELVDGQVGCCVAIVQLDRSALARLHVANNYVSIFPKTEQLFNAKGCYFLFAIMPKVEYHETEAK